MNDWMRRLSGLNSAAIARVEATTASWIALPHERREEPLQANHAAKVHRNQHGRERTVDEGAVYEDVYIEQVRT